MEFVDTNVLVYAYDPTSGDRHAAARVLLERLWQDRTGALSVQVLQEFFVIVTTTRWSSAAQDNSGAAFSGPRISTSGSESAT